MNTNFFYSPEFRQSPAGGQEEMEKRLWNYLDGLASQEEASAIEKLIAGNREWESKYQELLDIDRALHASELEQPSLRFTKNVMEEIARLHIAPATKNYINKKIIWGIATFFLTVIVGFLIYGFGQIDWSATGETKIPIEFSQVDYSRIFNNNFVNGFMIVNVLLALILLDRFLADKRKNFHKEA
jgi:hypothetical protein